VMPDAVADDGTCTNWLVVSAACTTVATRPTAWATRSRLRVGAGDAVTHNIPTCMCTTCASVGIPDAVVDDGTCPNWLFVSAACATAASTKHFRDALPTSGRRQRRGHAQCPHLHPHHLCVGRDARRRRRRRGVHQLRRRVAAEAPRGKPVQLRARRLDGRQLRLRMDDGGVACPCVKNGHALCMHSLCMCNKGISH